MSDFNVLSKSGRFLICSIANREISMSAEIDLIDVVTGSHNISPSALYLLLPFVGNKLEPIGDSSANDLATINNAYRFRNAILDFAGQKAGQIVYDRSGNQRDAIAAAKAAAKASNEQFTV